MNNEKLEIVNEHSYLGFIINKSGKFDSTIKMLCNKAQKATFCLNNIIWKYNLPINVSLKLYDSLIVPILTYGCDIWGTYLPNLTKKIRNQTW